MKQWRGELIKNIKIYMKQWRKDNPEYAKQYYLNSPEGKKRYKRQLERQKKLKHQKQYLEDNREKIFNEIEEKWRLINLRRKTDLKFNLNIRIKSAIRLSLKDNKPIGHWESLVGYTLADLIKRLDKTMPQGYAWQDLLTGKLHIDHITPINAFNFTKPEHTDFKRCWALSNLRLLPAKENLIKGARLDRPFQPALKI